MRFLLACLFLPVAAHAEPIRVHYRAYAAGLNVIAAEGTLDLAPQRYRISLSYQTTGTFALFVSSRILSQADGLFEGGQTIPRQFYAAGTLRGEKRLTLIDYAGGQPNVKQLDPSNEGERENVAPDLQRGTIDTLSAMARLIRRVTDTGKCEGGVRTFDGRRLSDMRAWTVGEEVLAPMRLSSFAGRALHCRFEGRQTGGFSLGEDRERLQRPQHGEAWFAALAPGQPMIPVRITFHTRWFGDATMFITRPD